MRPCEVTVALACLFCVLDARIVRLSVAAAEQARGRTKRAWLRAQRFGRIALSLGQSNATDASTTTSHSEHAANRTKDSAAGSEVKSESSTEYSENWSNFVSQSCAETSDAVFDSKTFDYLNNELALFSTETRMVLKDIIVSGDQEAVEKYMFEDHKGTSEQRDLENKYRPRKNTTCKHDDETDSSESVTEDLADALPITKRLQDPAQDYEIQYLIGFGSMARVFAALDKRTNIPVAIKTVRLSRNYSADLLRNELGALQAAGNHPHIVGYRDAFVTKSPPSREQKPRRRLWIVMDRVFGRTLQHAVSSGEVFDEDRMATVCRQLASALGHLHAAGYVHRDIKSANVMLEGYAGDTHSPVRLLDFGLGGVLRGRLSDDPSSTATCPDVQMLRTLRTFVGTPYTMAPEVISAGGVGTYDGPASDVWSLGIVLWEMAHGHPPHVHKYSTISKLFNAVVKNGAPPIYDAETRYKRREFSPELQDFYTKCTAYKAADRPSVQELLLHPFLALKSSSQSNESAKTTEIETPVPAIAESPDTVKPTLVDQGTQTVPINVTA